MYLGFRVYNRETIRELFLAPIICVALVDINDRTCTYLYQYRGITIFHGPTRFKSRLGPPFCNPVRQQEMPVIIFAVNIRNPIVYIYRRDRS